MTANYNQPSLEQRYRAGRDLDSGRGFEIQRRKVKTPDGNNVVTDCLVPKWSGDNLTADRPLHRQPCLHRVLAARRHDQITAMANNYGLLTVTVPRRSTLLIDAIWQQFAREVAGIIHCARCPAPNCDRWFFRSQTRSDRQYCSSTCRMRGWR